VDIKADSAIAEVAWQVHDYGRKVVIWKVRDEFNLNPNWGDPT